MSGDYGVAHDELGMYSVQNHVGPSVDSTHAIIAEANQQKSKLSHESTLFEKLRENKKSSEFVEQVLPGLEPGLREIPKSQNPV